MPAVGLLRDQRFHAHETTPNHPERPARLAAIEALLDDAGLSDACIPLEARLVTDDEILRVQKLLAARAGVFCEPASAVAVAGALKDIACGRIPAGATVVCTVTGHGLKDPDIAIRQSTRQPMSIAAERREVEKAILESLG